uniref:Transposase n=1 Tax=Ditylenchus dipsaci TaxID=166011 RepID=A0A915ESN5_9BILA
MQPLIKQTKKRGPNKEWTTLVVCKCKEVADEWSAENECFWIYHYSHNTMKYADQVYCCDHSSKNVRGISNARQICESVMENIPLHYRWHSFKQLENTITKALGIMASVVRSDERMNQAEE